MSAPDLSPVSLFDADSASPAARARATVADADAAYRADTITEYVEVRGDWRAELSLLAAASRYDRTHPGEPSLYDELHAIELYGPAVKDAA
ncbi:hypothetical protein [Streptomyces sp. NPDC054784]